MLYKQLWITILFAFHVINGYSQGNVLPDSLLKTLRSEHPRIIATATDFELIKQKIKSDPALNKRYQQLLKEGEEILKAPVVFYSIPDGLRLLSTSRRLKNNMLTLGFLFQITGDKKYAERGWKDLDAASNFRDWNPKHFLDVGEMTYGFAIGYDWMYDHWTKEQRTQLRNAIVEHGLNRALVAYKGLSTYEMGWWAKIGHNWNQVCNGGIGAGALAIAELEPKLCEEIVKHVVQNLPYAIKHYGPDGAWDEGPGYWSYATNYTIVILASLQSALGTDFGLSDIEGFSKTALFPIYMTGPTDRSFNYADSDDKKIGGAGLSWLINKYNYPMISKYYESDGASSVMDLLWNSSEKVNDKSTELPLDIYFRNAEVVSMRSKWADKNALFVGFKGGDNAANHSHLDLGSFVLDALGERWIVDLGKENYNLPQYFATAGTRWTYYRTRAESHNTLVFNPNKDPGQATNAKARIIKFNTSPADAFAIADLSAAYVKDMNSVTRGIAMVDRKRVIIRDEMQGKKGAEVNWFVHTPAAVNLVADGKKAILTLNGKEMQASILAPASARFTILTATPLPSSPSPEGINPNTGISRLSIQLKEITKGEIVVEIKPVTERSTYKGGFLKPLYTW